MSPSPPITDILRRPELARVGHDRDLARDANHQRVQLCLVHIRSREADLRIETVHAEEQVIRIESAQHLLGLGPTVEYHICRNTPPIMITRTCGKPASCIAMLRPGDDRNRAQVQALHLLRDLRSGGAGIENDRVVLGDQTRGRMGDAYLFRWCSVSLTDSRTSAWSRRLIAPPCDRTSVPRWASSSRSPRIVTLDTSN